MACLITVQKKSLEWKISFRYIFIYIHLHVERMCACGIRVRMKNDTWPDNNRCVMPKQCVFVCVASASLWCVDGSFTRGPPHNITQLLPFGKSRECTQLELRVAEFTCSIDIRPRLANYSPHSLWPITTDLTCCIDTKGILLLTASWISIKKFTFFCTLFLNSVNSQKFQLSRSDLKD